MLQQQHRHFTRQGRVNKEGNTVNPRMAFYEDLEKEIKRKDKGDHMVVGLDANEDMRRGATNRFFKRMGMEETVMKKKTSPPATCQRNEKREPIDGIFMTKGIEATALGYLPFREGEQFDQRAVWMEIDCGNVLGMRVPEMKNIQLTCGIHSLVSKYNIKLKDKLKKEKPIKEMENIKKKAKETGWQQDLEKDYNRIQVKI